jgi:N-acetylglutamate synthase-like GNAT family acetyltransferase
LISIRPATLEDTPAITALLHQLGYSETLEIVHDRLAALCAHADSAVLVAEDDRRRITGCAHVLIDQRLAEGRRGEISSIVVDDHLRSRGTGARLVQAAAAWLHARGIARLRIRCNARREQAHRFYEKLGFQLTKSQKVFDIPTSALVDRAAAS